MLWSTFIHKITVLKNILIHPEYVWYTRNKGIIKEYGCDYHTHLTSYWRMLLSAVKIVMFSTIAVAIISRSKGSRCKKGRLVSSARWDSEIGNITNPLADVIFQKALTPPSKRSFSKLYFMVNSNIDTTLINLCASVFSIISAIESGNFGEW